MVNRKDKQTADNEYYGVHFMLKECVRVYLARVDFYLKKIKYQKTI